MTITDTAPQTVAAPPPRQQCPHFFETVDRRFYCYLTLGHTGDHTDALMSAGTARHPNGVSNPHATLVMSVSWVA